jgi:peptidyl-prolyl cis-trans isomerase C
LLVGSLGLVAQVAADADDPVLASFTGGAITQRDFATVATQRLPAHTDLLTRPGALHELLESMIRYDLLVKEADARGYRENLTVRLAAQAKANELLIQDRATVAPDSISKAEIESAYAQHKREFSRPAMRRASHVVVATKAEAQALIGELKGATRERFAKVATEKSLDPATKHQGGELGYFDKDGNTERGAAAIATPQLAAAAFKLRAAGDVSAQPIQVPQGFSVMMLTGEMRAFETKRAEIDERLRSQLATEQGTAKLEALVTELRERYKPVVNASLVELVVMPPSEPAQIPSGFPAAPPDPREPPKMLEPDGI